MSFEFLNVSYLKKKICGEDLILFNEIIVCIENEAYRSASIIIWIAVLESLVRKLKILALTDDEIYEVMKTFEQEENEKVLLEKCKEHNLINQIEYEQLETIRQARNNYAHPTFESPSKEDVMIYLYYAVEYVLSKPNLFSKNSAKRELSKLLNDSNFLGNANTEQIKEFAQTFTNKIANDYFDEIIKTLFKMIDRKFNENDANNRICIKHGLIYAEVLLTDNFEYLNADNSNFLIDEYKSTSCHLFTMPNIWEYLDSRSKQRIYNYSMNNLVSKISKIDFINLFYRLYGANKLDEDLKTEYEENIINSSLYDLLYTEIPANLYYDKLIKEFKSYNYYDQNPAAIVVRTKDLSVFNNYQLEQLGRNILQSAEGGANDSERVIRIFERDGNVPKAFLRGLLFEILVNDDNELRIKPGYFENVMNIINDSQYCDEIFNEFIVAIRESKPKSLKFNNYEVILKRLKRLDINKTQYDLIICAIHESISNSTNECVEKLLELDYPKKFIPYLYNCLSEENMKKFVEFFSRVQRYVEDNENKIKVEIRWELLEQFIDLTNIKGTFEKMNLDVLSRVDKAIICEFLNHDS